MPETSTKEQQLELVERLQHLCLEDLITLYESKSVSAQDRATVIRFLSMNGWVLDTTKIPTKLKGKLTSQFKPDEDVDSPPLRIAR
jgi:hypothetical protein